MEGIWCLRLENLWRVVCGAVWEAENWCEVAAVVKAGVVRGRSERCVVTRQQEPEWRVEEQ